MSGSCYDVIIVGAGIAGLRVGIEVLKKYPKIKCCILEKYGYNGGRVVTYHKEIKGVGKVQWENGAGRISTSHKKVLSLFKKYNLTYVHISPETMWLDEGELKDSDGELKDSDGELKDSDGELKDSDGELKDSDGELKENQFSSLVDFYIKPLLNLPTYILQTHTLGQLLHSIHGNSISSFYLQFPYYAEIHTLRADLALYAFQNEMKSNLHFGVCKEGLSTLIDHMVKQFITLGGIILQNISLESLSYSHSSFSLQCFESCTHKKRFFQSSVCILALHHQALLSIKGVQHLPVLKKLKMEPLLRIYAVFPVKKKQSWFSGLSKIVTSGHIRHIIPMNPLTGTIMISYTDGSDARYWMKQSPHIVQSKIMSSIRSLFPHRDIPDPLFFKLHPWTSGCTYWLPGLYNVQEESMKSLQPNKKIPLFMCGESFAVHQAWMESALEQADHLLELDSFQSSLKQFK
jgi:Flavin containing amine oxidoreductase